MSFLSRYSYLLLSIVLLCAGTAMALVLEPGYVYGIATLLLGGALVMYWVAARRGALTPVNPSKRIRRGRASTRPVVVYFYSDFSLGCLLKRLLVAGAERQHKGHFDFIYIDINLPDGDATAEEYQAGTGDFILFDAAGNLVLKTGRITVENLNNVLERPAR